MAEKRVAKDRQGYPVDLDRPIVTDEEGVHTELSMTEKLGDKFVNMPTIWNGKRLNPDDAKEYDQILQHFEKAKAEGWQFPEFDNVDDAVAAAKDRSEYINKLRGKELQEAEKRMWAEEAAKRGSE